MQQQQQQPKTPAQSIEVITISVVVLISLAVCLLYVYRRQGEDRVVAVNNSERSAVNFLPRDPSIFSTSSSSTGTFFFHILQINQPNGIIVEHVPPSLQASSDAAGA